jgi:hypothetical protein
VTPHISCWSIALWFSLLGVELCQYAESRTSVSRYRSATCERAILINLMCYVWPTGHPVYLDSRGQRRLRESTVSAKTPKRWSPRPFQGLFPPRLGSASRLVARLLLVRCRPHRTITTMGKGDLIRKVRGPREREVLEPQGKLSRFT